MLFRDNLQHWLGDFARLLKVQFTSNKRMSDDAPIIAPVMRYEMTLVHVLMFISFLKLTSTNTVRTKIKVRVFYK